MTLPLLRPLEILRLPADDGVSFLLRDPEGYSDEELVVSEPALFVAAHLDGVRSRDEVGQAFRHRYGKEPDPTQIDALIERLESACFLETPAFFEERRRRQESFDAATLREPAHHGICYPAESGPALAALNRFRDRARDLEEEGERPEGRLRGLVAPHIDLRVGGPCTALAYETLAASPEVETVFVLGTAHGCPVPGWIVSEKPYNTPLGPVPLDEQASRRLAGAGGASLEERFYHLKEHSVEFQALFLAGLRERGHDLSMVPVLCGSLRGGIHPDDAGSETAPEPAAPEPPVPAEDDFLGELAALLAERGERAVVLAAADLAHVGPRFGDAGVLDAEQLSRLEERDRETLVRVTEGDPAGFFNSVLEAGDPRRICGLSPIYAGLTALPGVRGKVLRYEQATDESGTVSYASLALWG